ncbi:hypothetical protein [Idiomarina abyssalis]|uniref:Uncharacterized protein n=1 Tax=Idiomarina abyssalis TaxID=86102 RepID=A0A8I1G6K7_9GAMM|nr:hypothetical protein [Idiomarina abyssalis]MBJ7265607.1 hypothetical protein [Idiomarina abyssalis]MBJ7316719.1 hypothetical protein [Idiomarina abyssalis]
MSDSLHDFYRDISQKLMDQVHAINEVPLTDEEPELRQFYVMRLAQEHKAQIKAAKEAIDKYEQTKTDEGYDGAVNCLTSCLNIWKYYEFILSRYADLASLRRFVKHYSSSEEVPVNMPAIEQVFDLMLGAIPAFDAKNNNQGLPVSILQALRQLSVERLHQLLKDDALPIWNREMLALSLLKASALEISAESVDSVLNGKQSIKLNERSIDLARMALMDSYNYWSEDGRHATS